MSILKKQNKMKNKFTVTAILVVSIILTSSTQNIFSQTKDLGIGPVKTVEIGALDKKMADEGKSLYNSKCMVCHDLDQNKVGPSLRNVTKTRTPEFIMNLMLNTVQMQKENATIKELIKKYNNVPMPDPALKQNQARAVLEYLRSVVK